MGPQNAIIGDTFGTDLPEMRIPEHDLNEERAKAKFSRTAEFKRLKTHIEIRIQHHRTFLPGNVPAENVPDEERGKYWAVANMVIGELQAIIDTYEQAGEAVKEASRKQNAA